MERFIEGKRIYHISQLTNATNSERVFALAVLAVSHLALYREPTIFGKKPDFHVQNKKRYGNMPKKSDGIIVEVTDTMRRKIHKNVRKREQMAVLDRSGLRYTFLSGEIMRKLKELHSHK